VSDLDLVVRGGTVVTEQGRALADVGIRGSRVAQVGGPLRGARELDATGLFVLPGAVDPHVHLTAGPEPAPGVYEARPVDDFTSGSEAALAGGITTVGNMTFAGDHETMYQAIAREAALARAQAIADVFLHPVWPGRPASVEDDLRRLGEEGHRSLKLFTCAPEFDLQGAGVLRAVQAAHAAGSMTLIHCEDAAMIDCCTRAVLRGGSRGFRHYADCRPPVAEVVAVQRAVALCELTGAPIYIVHLSCARALEVCREARARGLPVHVETRPLYLHLTEERYAGERAALYVGQPPLRAPADREALWAGLADGSIDTVGSDHFPWRIADKLDERHTLDELRPGVPDLETMLPMLISEGQPRGLTLERVVALTASNPARLFGLYPRKGTIAAGADADLVLWDLRARRPVRATQMRSRSDYSPYEGTEVGAWPTLTIRRGEVVFADGRVQAAPGSGQLLARARSPVA
jgi:dihydropyrimidinase